MLAYICVEQFLLDESLNVLGPNRGQVKLQLNDFIHVGVLIETLNRLILCLDGLFDDLAVHPEHEDTARSVHEQFDGFQHSSNPVRLAAIEVIDEKDERAFGVGKRLTSRRRPGNRPADQSIQEALELSQQGEVSQQRSIIRDGIRQIGQVRALNQAVERARDARPIQTAIGSPHLFQTLPGKILCHHLGHNLFDQGNKNSALGRILPRVEPNGPARPVHFVAARGIDFACDVDQQFTNRSHQRGFPAAPRTVYGNCERSLIGPVRDNFGERLRVDRKPEVMRALSGRIIVDLDTIRLFELLDHDGPRCL